uniref:Membrane-associated guanylate kinase, WW and PDZ domain-containing protein 1 n=1 Tax=Ascaris suum TaxID=6253 RepID=F1KSV9_ASCSU
MSLEEASTIERASDDDELARLQESLDRIEICRKSSPCVSVTEDTQKADLLAMLTRIVKVRCHPNEVPFTVHGGAAQSRLILIELVHHSDLLNVLDMNDILLSIDGRKISGMLLSDVRLLLEVSFATKEFITLEVINGGSIPTDLRELLANREYAQLQMVIRDNVYQKTVPYTTRPPKDGEIDGVHYRFVDVPFFQHMQQTNQLLEHGHYQGHFYGTPKPIEEDDMVSDSKGPLPPNWEVAYSEQGEKYFIDHNSGTTQWEDPRELPEGWEKVDDRVYGTFYVDHVNKRTQYERPCSSGYQGTTIGGSGPPPANLPTSSGNGFDQGSLISNAFASGSAHNRHNRIAHYNCSASPPSQRQHSSTTMFTRDPSQLRGELITTRIVKGPKGLGFTLIGNDGSSIHEEFLQIKSIIPGGPAHRDGVLHMGDVLVYVNNECVLGATQSHACRIFQAINIGESVTLQVCRGYPLMLDPTNKIVTENAYAPRSHDEKEILIKKGDDGFGFTIFESLQGQRVKKILYPERCENLLEGDTLLEMRTTYPNGSPSKPFGQEVVTNFRGMPHHELVSVLRDCPVGFWAKLIVRRHSPRHRSRTPTAAFRYGEQRGTPVPSLAPRSKTPAPQPPRPVKTYSSPSTLPPVPHSLSLENGVAGGYYNPRNTIPRQHERGTHEEIYENFSRVRPSSTSLGFATPNYVPMTALFNDGSETVTVNLIRKPNGFGFRVVGGTEEGTCITVGQIVPGGAAAEDGRMRQGDEIIEIDGKNVVGESHATAVQLMQQSAANGHVKLIVRRQKEVPRSTSMPLNQLNVVLNTYDVVLTRSDHDGFGFVIISSVNKNGSTIGRIMEGSPAARCGQLRVGDRVIAVNGIDILSLAHNEIVNLIKDSGLSVRLTIAPPSPASPSQTGMQFSSSQTGLPYAPPSGRSLPYQNGGPQFSGAYNNPYETSHYRHLGQNGYSTATVSPIPPEAEPSLISVELNRGPKGFGFSIRGGQEFDAMPLFVLRIAEDGPAASDGKLRVGDQLIEINGQSTKGMTHANAIQIIKQYPTVKLLVRRPQGY